MVPDNERNGQLSFVKQQNNPMTIAYMHVDIVLNLINPAFPLYHAGTTELAVPSPRVGLLSSALNIVPESYLF